MWQGIQRRCSSWNGTLNFTMLTDLICRSLLWWSDAHGRAVVIDIHCTSTHIHFYPCPTFTYQCTDDARLWVRHSNMMNRGWSVQVPTFLPLSLHRACITYHTHNEIHIHMLNHIHYHHYHRHRLHFNSQLSTRCGQMSDKMATISPSQILTIRNRLPDKQ